MLGFPVLLVALPVFSDEADNLALPVQVEPPEARKCLRREYQNPNSTGRSVTQKLVFLGRTKA
jgi:hypothetical protein